MLDEEVRHDITEGGIKWQFTTALALWQGDFFERLVGLVKRSLQKSIGQKRLTLEQLITILAEVEGMLIPIRLHMFMMSLIQVLLSHLLIFLCHIFAINDGQHRYG